MNILRIYDYVFYAEYKVGISTRNYDDVPIIGGAIPIVMSFGLNVVTIILTLHHIGIDLGFPSINKYVLVPSLLGGLYAYYAYKGRDKRIVEKYDRKRKEAKYLLYRLPYFAVMALYVVPSVVILAFCIHIYDF